MPQNWEPGLGAGPREHELSAERPARTRRSINEGQDLEGGAAEIYEGLEHIAPGVSLQPLKELVDGTFPNLRTPLAVRTFHPLEGRICRSNRFPRLEQPLFKEHRAL